MHWFVNQFTTSDDKRNSPVELEVGEGEDDDKEEVEDGDGPNDKD